MEALFAQLGPYDRHDTGMDQAKKHIRPGVPRNRPLGVVDDLGCAVDAEPVGPVSGLHGRDGGRREARICIS
eukprot:11318957-Alexandrium_andersonii.AAC.1